MKWRSGVATFGSTESPTRGKPRWVLTSLGLWLAAVQVAAQPTAPATTSPNIVDPALSAVDVKIESELQRTSTPGAALVVVRDGRIVHARGYGLADVETHRMAD